MFLYRAFIFYFLLQFLIGCGGPGTTAVSIYNKAFTDLKEVNCPKGRFIKGINKLVKTDSDEGLIYSVTFSELDWYCYINKGDEYKNYIIELNIGFNVVYSDKNVLDKDENFEYVIAVLDINDRVIFTNKYLFNLHSDNGLLNFYSKDKEKIIIKINIEKVDYLDESTLLLGFIK